MLKRSFDILISVSLLLAAAPMLSLLAIFIKIDSPGTLFYRSRRVGKNGREFDLLKLRTMSVGSPKIISSFGKFLRNYSLDEIPTLWNVLKGDLSLVGPRPEIPQKVEADNPSWRLILSVRPGIVGNALVTFADSYNSTEQSLRAERETAYIRSQSFLNDLRILRQAAFKVLRMGNIKGKMR